MSKEFNARALDVKTFAEAAAELSGAFVQGGCERLMTETEGRGADKSVAWRARGELRNPRHVQPDILLHLRADAVLSLTCQRCLGPVDVAVAIDRDFRFVADEATAEAEDDESEEDLLVTSRSFDLVALIEDELLMDLPLVPQHATCPHPPVRSVADPDFEEESPKENPFAVLGRLKGGKP